MFAHSPSARTGGANRDRTDALLLAKQALSQLSYGPADLLEPRVSPLEPRVSLQLVGLDGFEPSTPALSRRCSNQLSYRPEPTEAKPQGTTDRWWALRTNRAL